MWWIIASGALVNFNLYALATFFPAFLTRYHGLSVGQAGFWAGCRIWRGGHSRRSHGGRVGRSRRAHAAGRAYALGRRRCLAGRARGAGGHVAAGRRRHGIHRPYHDRLWFPEYVLRAGVFGYSRHRVAPTLRGTTMAIYFLAMYLCGAAFGPLITGRLSDYLARSAARRPARPTVGEAFRAIGLHQAMYVIPVCSAGLALALYAGSRTIAADMARRDAAARRPVLQPAS